MQGISPNISPSWRRDKPQLGTRLRVSPIQSGNDSPEADSHIRFLQFESSNILDYEEYELNCTSGPLA
jgi:hypothetical protein